jgi:hypothetical protein
MLEMRPFGMPGDLRLLPRRQLCIGVLKQLLRLRLQPCDFGFNVDVARARGLAKLVDPLVERGDRLFEF